MFVATAEDPIPFALNSLAVKDKPGSEKGTLEQVKAEDADGRVQAEGLECWQDLQKMRKAFQYLKKKTHWWNY